MRSIDTDPHHMEAKITVQDIIFGIWQLFSLSVGALGSIPVMDAHVDARSDIS